MRKRVKKQRREKREVLIHEQGIHQHSNREQEESTCQQNETNSHSKEIAKEEFLRSFEINRNRNSRKCASFEENSNSTECLVFELNGLNSSRNKLEHSFISSSVPVVL